MPLLFWRLTMATEDFREMYDFVEAYRTIPYSSVRSDFNTIGAFENNELHGLYIWLRNHYEGCRYFNGFSIAKPPRDRRNEEIIVRCSCGDSTIVSSSLWHLRIRNTDIEDIIENLNYRCRDRCALVKNLFEYNVNQEILRRKMAEEAEAKNMCSKAKEKNGLNSIFSLEV